MAALVCSSYPQRSFGCPTPRSQESAFTLDFKSCFAILRAENLKHIAEQSSMVLALGDVGSTVVWTASSPEMRKVAENVHLIEGGQWR